MVPVGNTPAFQDGNGIVLQGDLFMYKTRECKSAPARTSKDVEKNSATSRNSVLNHRKKNYLTWNKLLHFFVGHAPEFASWTTSYVHLSKMKYYSLFFVESSLRSIGDVTFCSNPFSGLMIFVAMLISCPQVAFLAFITLAFGILTAIIFLKLPVDEVRAGGTTFNNFLTGTVIALLADEEVLWKRPDILLICMTIGILTVIIWRGLNGSIASQFEFPLLNAPFHVIILLYMLSGIAAKYKPEAALQIQGVNDLPVLVRNSSGSSDADAYENGSSLLLEATTIPSNDLHELNHKIMENSDTIPSIDWERLVCGICLAPSQVFGTNNLITSFLVHMAVFVYSPIMLSQTMIGAAIGTMIGVCLSDPGEYEMLYNGSWGYNPLFTSAAMGGFFLVFNVYSWLTSIVGSILTTLLYSAMVKCHVPVLGIPFMLTTWLLIPGISYLNENTSEEDNNAVRVRFSTTGPFYRIRLSDITTPEQHRNFLTDDDRNDPTDKYKSTLSPPSAIPIDMNTVLPL